MSESTTTGGGENYPTGTAQRLIQRLEDAAADTLFCIEADREEAVEIAAQEIAAALAAQPAPVREGVDLRPAREALVRMRDSGIQDVDQWASRLGPDLARAGEAEFAAPPAPEPVAPPAGEDLAALSAAATLDTRAALSALARFSDQACRAGGFMYLHDALKELGEEAREYDPEVGIFSNREYAAACDALAYLVETVSPNGITLAKTIDAALLPAPTQPAAQGEPVAAKPDGCILCCNGAELPPGEYCRACGRVSRTDSLLAALNKVEGRNVPPTTKVAFASPTQPAATGRPLSADQIERSIGGAYEMPDGRKFWIDGPVAREMARRVLSQGGGEK